MSAAILTLATPEYLGENPTGIMEHEASDSDLAALIKGIAANDQQAFTRLYHLTVDRVYSLARFMLKNSQDAEEITTDVYAQTWEVADRYDPTRGSVITWLLMRCRSRSLDLIRRIKVRQTTHDKNVALSQAENERAGSSPEDILHQVQEGSAVQKALSELSPQRREVLTLAYFRGMSHGEIAKTTGLPVGTVKSHVRRAVQTLREHVTV